MFNSREEDPLWIGKKDGFYGHTSSQPISHLVFNIITLALRFSNEVFCDVLQVKREVHIRPFQSLIALRILHAKKKLMSQFMILLILLSLHI